MPTSITGQGLSVYPAPDNELSSTSKKPVQNKIVTQGINAKQTAPQTTGTAGQVLGLDNNLAPVWVNQSGEGGGSGITEDIKLALLQLAQKVTYVDDDGQDYYDDLYNALYHKDLASLTAVYTKTTDVYDCDDLDSLKKDIVVTAHYTDGTTGTISQNLYTLSGTLTEGTSTITVSYGGQTANVTVSGVIHVLYRLPEQFVSDGTNYIDTGIAWEANKQYSLVCTCVVSQFTSDVRFIYGDSYADGSGYTALACSNVASGSTAGNYLWGSGFGYAASKNFASANNVVKLVFTWDVGISGGPRNWYIKNVSAGTEYNGTTNFSDLVNVKGHHEILGKQENGGNAGFLGTIRDFKIYDRILTAEEITAYMGA